MQAGSFNQNACFLCKQSITTDRFVEVGLKLIHYECFKCRQCKDALRKETCKVNNNRFYCDVCYLKLFCARCKICTKSIFPHDIVMFQGKKIHQTCLVCTFCKMSLGVGQHFQVGEELYCSPKCAYEKRKKDRAPPPPAPKPVVVEAPKPAEGGGGDKPAEGAVTPADPAAQQPPPATPDAGAQQPPPAAGGDAPPAANPPPPPAADGAAPAPK